jgi:hypothetical protein
MQKTNSQILDHLYGLLIEMNFHRPDEDILNELDYKNDPFIQKHLQRIKLKTAKSHAKQNKNQYSVILQEIKRLKEIGFDKIKTLLTPQEEPQMLLLFRRFEELSEKDEASLAEDQELLGLISALKEKLDKPENE